MINVKSITYEDTFFNDTKNNEVNNNYLLILVPLCADDTKLFPFTYTLELITLAA